MMVYRILKITVLTSALVVCSGFALAADKTGTQQQTQTQMQQEEQIYGSQLMTQQERDEYRAQMRATKTAEERDRIRNEHHERMMERAKERGVSIPDEPPAMGGGMGPGGGGMGPGGGMGKGGGRNR